MSGSPPPTSPPATPPSGAPAAPPYVYPPPPPPPPPGWAPAPPPRPSDHSPLLIIVVVVVVIVVALAAVGFYLAFVVAHQVSQTTQATVTGATWTFVYQGSTSGYLGSSSSSCGGCPYSGFVGTTFSLTLHLASTDTTSSHSITIVSIDAPFTFVSTSPALPASVSVGNPLTLTVTIEYPVTPGSYALTGTIYTS